MHTKFLKVLKRQYNVGKMMSCKRVQLNAGSWILDLYIRSQDQVRESPCLYWIRWWYLGAKFPELKRRKSQKWAEVSLLRDVQRAGHTTAFIYTRITSQSLRAANDPVVRLILRPITTYHQRRPPPAPLLSLTSPASNCTRCHV